ncbi:Ig-like domain-containing protein [Clostridium vincentii]|uniref:Ig-like domain-containing protein n=1 Tax=Clostridium vincentii TaxID=52704 RepID=UPI001A9A54E6|nr:Ig-like domain-containing protein [Clostridium vincentii]
MPAGTYYLRLWAKTAGSYTYFARQIPTKTASLEICISLKKGQSVQLGTVFNNCKNKDVKWSSLNKEVSTVSSKGEVKALKKGTTTIKEYNSSGLVSKIKIIVVQ